MNPIYLEVFVVTLGIVMLMVEAFVASTDKRYLAYVPEGPVLDWADLDLADALTPLAAHVKAQGAFGIRIGPPVVTARWDAQQVKDGIADDDVRRLADLDLPRPVGHRHPGAAAQQQLSDRPAEPARAAHHERAAGEPGEVLVHVLTPPVSGP